MKHIKTRRLVAMAFVADMARSIASAMGKNVAVLDAAAWEEFRKALLVEELHFLAASDGCFDARAHLLAKLCLLRRIGSCWLEAERELS